MQTTVSPEAKPPEARVSPVPAGAPLTVHSMLKRLENKGLVLRDREGHVHQFSALVDRSWIAGQQLEEMADKLADGGTRPRVPLTVDRREQTMQIIEKILAERQR